MVSVWKEECNNEWVNEVNNSVNQWITVIDWLIDWMNKRAEEWMNECVWKENKE